VYCRAALCGVRYPDPGVEIRLEYVVEKLARTMEQD